MHIYTDRLSGACPVHRARMIKLLDELEKAKIPVMIVRCWSSLEDQLEKYRVGRTYDLQTKSWKVIGNTITNAFPGSSAHNIVDSSYNTPASCASDIIPVDKSNRPIWDYPLDLWKKNIYPLVGKCGLDAYGDPWGRYLGFDLGHIEEPAWDITLSSMSLKKLTLPLTYNL